jgi:Bacterial membrane protein YfhO
VYLIALDAPLPSSSSTPYQPTTAVTALQRTIGSSLVGLGVDASSNSASGLAARLYTSSLGFEPNSNVLFGIHQFSAYDPISPLSWFGDWIYYNHTPPGSIPFYTISPVIKSATVARRYGIAYVLVRSGAPGPTGSVFDRRVGKEDLYRIPGAATATLLPVKVLKGWPPTDKLGKAVNVEWPNPSTARVVTTSSTPQVLRIRIASVPGWHATIDGQPLALFPYLSMMFEAYVPPGHHVIELTYWPKQFSEGIVLAGLAVAGLAVAGVVVWRRSVTTRTDPRLTSE